MNLHQQAALMIRSLLAQMRGGVSAHIVFHGEGNIISEELLKELEAPGQQITVDIVADTEGVQLLLEAAALYRFYEASHRQKNTKDGLRKAERNAEIAGRIERYLTKLAEAGHKVGDGTGDAAIAIAEHAFRAGFDGGVKAAAKEGFSGMPGAIEFQHQEEAWSEYDPPEHIKDLS